MSPTVTETSSNPELNPDRIAAVDGERAPELDSSDPQASGPPNAAKAARQTRPRSDRPWRILGLLTMFGAIAILAYSLYGGLNAETGQARIDASNLQPVRIEVNNLGVEQGMTAGVINGGERDSIDATGVFSRVLVPMDAPSIIGLYRPGGTLVGLTRFDPQSPEPAVDPTKITPRTTAQTLVSLFPGVASRDLQSVNRRVTEATIVPEFKDLERAVLASEGLLNEDRSLQFALGATVGRLSANDIQQPACTAAGLALGGVCITRGENGIDIANQLGRWALLFDAEDAVRLCAAVPPAPSVLTLTDTGACSPVLHLAAPGPVSEDRLLPGGNSTGQIQIASALDAFSSWGVPVADLLFGTSAQSDSATINRIASETAMINTQIRSTLSGDDTLRQHALDYGDPGASPRKRASATLELSTALMRNSRMSRDLLGGSVLGNNDATELLELIARSIEWVPPNAPVPFWQTFSTAEIDLTRFIGPQQ